MSGGRGRRSVTWTTDYYAPWCPGGSSESVRLLARAVARSVDLTIVTPAWGAAPLEERIDGVRVVRFPTGLTLPPMATAPDPVTMSSRFQRAARRTIEAVGGELVHAQDRRLLGAAVAAARATGARILLTLRDVGLLCPIATCLLDRDTVPDDCGQRRLWSTCAPEHAQRYGAAPRLKLAVKYGRLARDRRLALDGVGFVSDGLRRVYGSAGWPPARTPTAVLPSPVEDVPPMDESAHRHVDACFTNGWGLQRFDPVCGYATAFFQPVVLYVGKPSIGKGWAMFSAAAERLYGRAKFVQVGSPPAEHQYVVSYDGVDHANALRWIRSAAIVCVPAQNQDALPRVALEAAMQERPVVGTRVGGIPEIVAHGETGLLVRPGDVDGFVFAVRSLLDSPLTAEAMGLNARQYISERFSEAVCADKVVELYEQIASLRSGAPERAHERARP